jgi:hypothetical protein
MNDVVWMCITHLLAFCTGLVVGYWYLWDYIRTHAQNSD